MPSKPHTLGRYRGVGWNIHPICQIIPCNPSKTLWYFIYEDGEPTGDHFKTQQEMRLWIDKQLKTTEPEGN